MLNVYGIQQVYKLAGVSENSCQNYELDLRLSRQHYLYVRCLSASLRGTEVERVSDAAAAQTDWCLQRLSEVWKLRNLLSEARKGRAADEGLSENGVAIVTFTFLYILGHCFISEGRISNACFLNNHLFLKLKGDD